MIRNRCRWLLAVMAVCAFVPEALAIGFEQDGLEGNLDTTITVGAAWRVQNVSDDIVGQGNGGQRGTTNFDNGDRAYPNGRISTLVDVTSDLDLRYRNVAAFFRANAFYDAVNADKAGLSSHARDQVGRDVGLLDAYLSADLEPFGHGAQLRFGRQVISWGESTFIPGGINVVNPADLARFRSPGVEVRQILLPVNSLWASVSLDERVELEGFMLGEFKPLEADECGTYFSTADALGESDRCAGINLFGTVPDGTPGNVLPRGADRRAGDSGQFGLALRYFAADLADTEFGFYYVNYHERVPLFSGVTVTGLLPSSGSFFYEYPEDIDLFGISFNSEFADAGVALQGEFSFRRHQPLQRSSAQVTQAILGLVNQIQTPVIGTEVRGYQRHNVAQAQLTATRIIGEENPFGASSWALAGEVAVNRIMGMPKRNVLPLDSVAGQFADSLSWGYSLLTQWDYPGALGPVTLSPRLAYSHDVNGYTPAPLATFLEGRKAMTLGLSGHYLDRWQADISYTSYFGAGSANLLHDRDFVAVSLKYSF